MNYKQALPHFFDFFFSMRPVLLVPVWGFSAFGYFKAKDNLNIIEIWKTTTPEVYFFFFLFSLSVGVVYILNQIADINVDKKNGGFPLIASGVVSLKEAWYSVIFLSFITVGFPLFMKYPLLSFFSLATLATGVLYSFKPTFFSGRLFLDFISNGFGYGCIAFGVGWWAGGKDIFTSEFIIASLPYFLLMCSGSINSTLPDVEGDESEGKRTTAVVLGLMKAHFLSTLLLIISLSISIVTKDYIASICALVSLPFYIIYYFYAKRFMMEATYKIGGGICMIIACILMPYILLLSGFIFYGTRIYFKKRHGISYPSMVPSQNEI